ncbi:MAG: TIGR00282 family metallophosphoesterase [Chloroflexi bacterium]|nr:MAG: metallophosphoesterase [Actinobacteria bacterium 13_2_20CM_2_66_6]TMD36997.1 MAG: TIGR00282 family metallophosphoesterase [Chloroflexota bacterium]TMD72307.1 MAG: TIGR00282 family metallophosphoesterase [Chloroflexota bacterium]
MPGAEFRILFVADVVGHPGRDAVKALLPGLKKELRPHLTIVNGENAAGGFGLTAKIVAELRASGADVVTSGNHVFAQKEFVGELPNLERVLRPANYPSAAPGQGWCLVDAGGHQVLVMNLIGRIFLEALDDPFRAADAILAAHPGTPIVFCDMHAEATSEKTAMGWYLDGRASAVVGTHTHVPTADARILPGGTAYVTDVGMVGPRDGCIGMDKDVVLQRFLSGVPNRFVVASGPVTFNSVLVTINSSTGRATSIQRVDREHS